MSAPDPAPSNALAARLSADLEKAWQERDALAARLEQCEAALRRIADAFLGDHPASSLRQIARDALARPEVGQK